MSILPAGGDLLFLAYVGAFGLSAVACFASLRVLDRIEDADTRRGLRWLLLLSGSWAGAHVAFLIAPSAELSHAFYHLGLVVGFAATGPWLYFCSAYTGRTFHRNRRYRRIAVGVYLSIVLVKVTNSIHGLYFVAEPATTPFAHLAVQHQPLHWLVMGLAYALAVVGYFMLFELFTEFGFDTRPLAILVALTGLPVLLAVAGHVSPVLLDMTYEPIGVALFSVGVLFVFAERFETVRLATAFDDPVVYLDEDDRIRDCNPLAEELFPELVGARGEPIGDVVPSLEAALDEDPDVLSIEGAEGMRHFRVATTPIHFGQSRVGRVLTFDDVTRAERHRRELERQNERLERFASVVSHDLRNPLNVAQSRLDLARAECDSEHFEDVAWAHDRMGTLIDDLLTLARQGQDIDATDAVDLSTFVERCWRAVEAPEATVVVEDPPVVEADPDRLQQLLENLFRNAVEHVGPDVTVRVGALEDGFYVEDDGPGIPEAERDDVFEPGHTTAEDGTGFGLAIVAEIARAHGWSVRVTDGTDGGARFEFTGVEMREAEAAADAAG